MVLIKGSRAMGMERLIEPIRAAFAPGAAPADARQNDDPALIYLLGYKGLMLRVAGGGAS